VCSKPTLGLVFAVAVGAAAAAADDPFAVLTIPGEGRTVAAEMVDLNGDGRTDLLQIVFSGVPPDDRRRIRVYFQTSANTLPTRPDFEIPLPAESGAYDLADVRSTPGQELILLRPDDVLILSLNGPRGEQWRLPVVAPGTACPAPDDRGIERLRLVWTGLAPEPLLLVPQLGSLALMSVDGALRAQLRVGARANYLVPAQPTLLFIESDVQLYFDTPRLSVADVDGDGALDIVAATRHEVRVFVQRADATFLSEPDRVYPLHVMSERNHIRGSGGVSVQARDVDGDGRADLLVSHLTGGLTDAHLATALYLNRDGSWDLEQPNARLESNAALGSDTLLDVDGDGRPELLRTSIPFSVLKLIQSLLTHSVSAKFSLHRLGKSNGFGDEPWVSKEVDLALNVDTFRPRGFLPAWHLDLNGDGQLDLLTSGDGDEINVFLGGERRYAHRDARQKVDSEGLLRSGDLDGDHLPDIVLFDPMTPGASVRVLRNRGILPGTAPRISAPLP